MGGEILYSAARTLKVVCGVLMMFISTLDNNTPRAIFGAALFISEFLNRSK